MRKPLLLAGMLILLLLGPVQAEDQDTPPLDEKARRAFIARLVKEIGAAETGLRPATVIWDLPARYGTFADLDSDGDLDYLATEMSHRSERVTVFLRTGDSWRRGASVSRHIAGRHPFTPWVLPDDGEGRPAVVVPLGWAPYFVVYPTDGHGRLLENRAKTLERLLPRRRSKPEGVDNQPYRITRVERNPKGGSTLHGVMRDATKSGRPFHSAWRIELSGGSKRMTLRGHRGRVRSPYDGTWRRPVVRGASFDESADRAAARLAIRKHWLKQGRLPPDAGPNAPNDPTSPLHRGEIGRYVVDADGDGIDDLVALTTDFAAHVFRGRQERQGGKITFAKESTDPACLDLRVVRSIWAGAEERVAESPALHAEMIRLSVTRHPGERVPLRVVANFAYDRIYYRWDGRRLVPSIVRHQHYPSEEYVQFPHITGSYRYLPFTQHHALHQTIDGDGDGVGEMLVSMGVSPRTHQRPTGTEPRYAHLHLFRGVLPSALAGELDLNSESQAGILPVVDARFPVKVTFPVDRHEGYPLEVESVGVAGRGDRARVCIYFRPWNVGIFLEPRDE